jgi:hypothetical protein
MLGEYCPPVKLKVRNVGAALSSIYDSPLSLIAGSWGVHLKFEHNNKYLTFAYRLVYWTKDGCLVKTIEVNTSPRLSL